MDYQFHPDSNRGQLSVLKLNSEQPQHPHAPENLPRAPPVSSRSSIVNCLLLVAVVLLGGCLLVLLSQRTEQQLRNDLENSVRTELKDTSDRLELAQVTKLAAIKKITEAEVARNHNMQSKLDLEIEELEGLQQKIAQKDQKEKQEKENYDKIIINLQKEKESHEKIMSDLKKEREDNEKMAGELKKIKEDSQKMGNELKKEKENGEKIISELKKIKEDHEKILGDLKKQKQDRDKTIGDLKKEKENNEKIVSELKKQNESNNKTVGEVQKGKEKLDKKVIVTSDNIIKSGYVSKPPKGAPAKIENPNVVINIEYPEKDYLPLPIDFFRKNSQGKIIAEVLYPDAEQRKKREQFHKDRIAFLDGRTHIAQAFLTKYNNPLNEAAEKEGREANEKEWVRLNSTFGFDKIKAQLPMCIMVPGYNNNANFRIEYNLNSIFIQNYTNYKVVIIDDKSTDNSGAVYRNYFAFHRIDKSRYAYIQNSKRVTALQNIYLGSLNHCGEDSFVITIDADDQFIGRNVLQVFNWGYQTKKAGVLYTNFIRYEHKTTLMYGFTQDYSQQIKKENHYRYKTMKFSHLRSYRNELLGQIDPKDLQDDKGVFFTITYDLALFIPLMELSCGRVHKIEGEFHYLYNTGTGLNDYNDRGRQIQVEKKIRRMKRYECNKEFHKRMSQ